MRIFNHRATAFVFVSSVLLALALSPWATAQEPGNSGPAKGIAAVATTNDEVAVQEILRISGWPI